MTPLLTFCRWIGKTHIGLFMRDSTYAFATVEVVHLLSLALFGGLIMLVNLRLLGLSFKGQPVSQVTRELLPITSYSLLATFLSGFFLFVGGAVRYYHNPAFQFKVLAFLIALVFHFVIQVKVSKESSGLDSRPALLRFAAVLSLLLWFSVGLAGRAIGYV